MSEGIKYDSGKKARPGLIPPKALLAVSEVLAYGAAKYSDDNWKHVRPVSRYVDAAMRHLLAYLGGEKNDPESGLSHLAHATCCTLFLLAHEVGDVVAPEPEQLELPMPGPLGLGARVRLAGAFRTGETGYVLAPTEFISATQGRELKVVCDSDGATWYLFENELEVIG